MEKIAFKIKINPQVNQSDWRAYVDKHPEGTIYHLSQWQDILKNSFGHQRFLRWDSRYLFAYDNDRICGFLPLYKITSLITGRRMVSLPFSYICGPIADSAEINQALIEKAVAVSEAEKCQYLEIRSMFEQKTDLKISHYFSTCELKISGALDEVWQKLDKGSVRWAIKKAQKDGVEVMETADPKDLEIFYNLNLETKKSLGAPAHPLTFLKNIQEKFPELSKLYLAKKDGKVIAGIFNLNYKNTIIYGYAAAKRSARKFHPNNLLVWRSIEDGNRDGYKIFDFGRAAFDNSDLMNFKKRWGGAEKELFYYYDPEEPKKLSNHRNGIKYKIINKVWSMMPTPVSRVLSNILFGHFD